MKCFGESNKTCHCKIVFLDDTELLQEIQSVTVGQDLLDVAFKQLNLLETAYFGLRFIDKTNQTHWLDGSKKVTKQLKGTDPFTLYFGVKFYSSDPCKLLEEITRYQFFLQVKQDVLQERLPVPFELATELAAYAVQSELGDFDHRRHQAGYVGEFKFVTQQSSQFETHVTELHKTLIGQVPAIAELNYLEKVKWLDMYGVDLHPVLGEDNVEYFLGLTPSGVIVLRNKSKVGNYFWPRITKVYFKGKYFMLRVRDKNNDESTYGFELPSKQACKHLWKCCVEHHSFFRLTQVSSPISGKVFGLSSRFSGRSDKSGHLPHQFGLQSNRMQPQVVRVASRRYQRRLGQPDGIDSSLKEKDNEKLETRSNISIPQPVHLPKSKSVPALPDSPRSVRSAPWEDPRHRGGMFSSSTNPSPRSVRSAGWKLPSSSSSARGGRHRHRSPSADSEDSGDSRRRRHHHRHHRSRRNSDNESEKSVGKHSSVSRKHGGSGSNGYHHKESSSELEISHKSRSHSGKFARSSSNYELIDSEAQWSQVQKQKHNNDLHMRKSQSAVIRDLSARKSGYTNSGMESESEANFLYRKRHRKHRSRSPPTDQRHSKALPPEIKKHIAYQLIDSTSMSENQLKDIPYTNVESEAKAHKVKYSPNSHRRNRNSTSRYSTHRSNISSSEMKMCLRNDEDEDSPPPPYSPSADQPESNRRLPTPGQEEVSISRSSHPPANNGSSNLYDLDLISTHPKSFPLANRASPPSSASSSAPSGGKNIQRTTSTNNLSNGDIGPRIPITINGMSVRPSNGHANTIDSSRSYREYPASNDRSNQHFSTMNGYPSSDSYAYDCGLPNDFANNCRVTSSEILPPTALMPGSVNNMNFVQSSYSSTGQMNQLSNGQSNQLSNGQSNQLSNGQSSFSSSGQSLSRQQNHASNGQLNYSSSGQSLNGQSLNRQASHASNGQLNHSLNGQSSYASNRGQSNYSSNQVDYRQSRPPLPPPSGSNQHSQQYYGQSYPNVSQHSTLPARTTNKMIYPQQLSNGYGHSSVGKASAITMGVGQANHIRPPPQFASSHMASYHTKMFPATEAQFLSSIGQSQQQSEHNYVKSGNENHHEMSTEL